MRAIGAQVLAARLRPSGSEDAAVLCATSDLAAPKHIDGMLGARARIECPVFAFTSQSHTLSSHLRHIVMSVQACRGATKQQVAVPPEAFWVSAAKSRASVPSAAMEKWQKALLIGGGAAATAGLLWYLLRDGGDEEVDIAQGSVGDAPKLFKVTDPNGCSIGIRAGPDVNAPRTGAAVLPGEIFPVSHIVEGADEQRYLLLADGRGWVFTHSGRDGRLLAQEATPEQLSEKKAGIQMMMEEANRMLEKDPALRQEVMKNPAVLEMMANPQMIQTAAENSASVASALRAQPGVESALSVDPTALAGSLREAAGDSK